MKLSLASLALLGLPAALAAAAAEFYAESNPNAALQPECEHDIPLMDPEIVRLQARDTPKQTTSSGPASSTAKSLTTRASPSSSSANPSTITEFAVFTVGSFGIPYTVTSISGSELVDGKVLSPGGPPLLIGGAQVSEATNGALLVNGAKVPFSTGMAAPSSSSVPPPAATTSSSGSSSSSSAASSSASAAASSSSTSSKNAAVAVATRAAGAGAAVVGAVIGALMW